MFAEKAHVLSSDNKLHDAVIWIFSLGDLSVSFASSDSDTERCKAYLRPLDTRCDVLDLYGGTRSLTSYVSAVQDRRAPHSDCE